MICSPALLSLSPTALDLSSPIKSQVPVVESRERGGEAKGLRQLAIHLYGKGKGTKKTQCTPGPKLAVKSLDPPSLDPCLTVHKLCILKQAVKPQQEEEGNSCPSGLLG